MNVWLVTRPTRSVAVRRTVWVEPIGEVGTSKPAARATPSTVAAQDATPEAVSLQRKSSGTRPFTGTVAPGWSRATVGGLLSTGANSVAS